MCDIRNNGCLIIAFNRLGVPAAVRAADELAALWASPAGEAQRQCRLLCLAASAGDSQHAQVKLVPVSCYLVHVLGLIIGQHQCWLAGVHCLLCLQCAACGMLAGEVNVSSAASSDEHIAHTLVLWVSSDLTLGHACLSTLHTGVCQCAPQLGPKQCHGPVVRRAAAAAPGSSSRERRGATAAAGSWS
jgi:hypothetical protein